MADELIDIYDENMAHLGTNMKSVAHREGLWHCAIHCWIVRPAAAGFVLFQKRAADKDLFPNLLDISAAGHYQAGELPQDGVREILEELGVHVEYKSLVSLGIKIDLGRYDDIVNHEFCRTYLLVDDRAITDYTPDPAEVEGLVQISISDGLALFAGRESLVRATGVEWDPKSAQWLTWDRDVSIASFIPRVDAYYYKVFIMAQRLLAGAIDLSI